MRNSGHLVDYLLTSDSACSLWPSIEEGYRIFIRMVSTYSWRGGCMGRYH